MMVFSLAALEPLALQGGGKLAAAILFGIVLGILLVKCEFADRQQVKNNLTFSGMKLTKTILLALGLGVILFAVLRSVHVVQDSLPEITFWGGLVGAVCTGIGLGIGGLVPITAVSALASGRFYAIWVLLGMFAAVPTAKLLRGVLPGMSPDAQAVSANLKPTNGIFAFDSPVLWISAAALMLCLIMMIFGSRDDS